MEQFSCTEYEDNIAIFRGFITFLLQYKTDIYLVYARATNIRYLYKVVHAKRDRPIIRKKYEKTFQTKVKRFRGYFDHVVFLGESTKKIRKSPPLF